MTRVLFVVPTLGERPDWLRQTLASVRAQDVPVDLRIVAPGSAPIAEVCREYGAEAVICDEPGISRAINVGFEAGVDGRAPTHHYAAWLGDDDLLAPGSLRATVDALDMNPEASAAYGQCRFITADGETMWLFRPGPRAGRVSRRGINRIPQPGSLFRYKALLAVNGLDETYRHAMDYDLFLRLQEMGPLQYVDRELAAFRVHDASTTVGKADYSETDRARGRFRSRSQTLRDRVWLATVRRRPAPPPPRGYVPTVR